MCFAGVYGPPFVRDGGVRRDATLADYERFCQLAQSFDELDSAGGTIVEPNDAPLDSRHLDMVYRLLTLTDKPFMGSVVSAERARDTLAHVRHRVRRPRGHRADAASSSRSSTATRRCAGTTACSSRALEYHRANQPVVITPFLLMGAMSPVSIPATLAQQLAEVLAGISLAQLARPGCPVILGSFLSNIDMQSGSPQFGTPGVGDRPAGARARSRAASACRGAPAAA